MKRLLMLLALLGLFSVGCSPEAADTGTSDEAAAPADDAGDSQGSESTGEDAGEPGDEGS